MTGKGQTLKRPCLFQAVKVTGKIAERRSKIAVLAGGHLDNVCNHFTDELEQREVLQQDIEKAPCITFGQFREVADQQWWSIEWFAEHGKGEIDRPVDILRRIMHGTMVDGRHHQLADLVIRVHLD
jgi:hypothetical protein